MIAFKFRPVAGNLVGEIIEIGKLPREIGYCGRMVRIIGRDNKRDDGREGDKSSGDWADRTEQEYGGHTNVYMHGKRC